MTPETTALLIVDDNNDFFHEDGKLYGALSDFFERHQTLENLDSLIAEMRAAGVTIIRAPMSFEPGYPEMGTAPYGIFEVVKNAGSFEKGSWGAAPSKLGGESDSDVVIEGKCSLDTFETTALDEELKARGITTLVVAGVLSNLCISSTMRTAYDNGYRVVPITDACAALTEEHHADTVRNDFPLISQPMSKDELSAALTQQV